MSDFTVGDPYTELGVRGGQWLGRVRPMAGPPANTARNMFTRSGLLLGASVLVGGSAGSISVYDGTDTSGVAVLSWGGVASDAKTYWYGPNGLWFENGLYVGANSNVTVTSVFWVDLYAP